jgi:hypothetical protein
MNTQLDLFGQSGAEAEAEAARVLGPYRAKQARGEPPPPWGCICPPDPAAEYAACPVHCTTPAGG